MRSRGRLRDGGPGDGNSVADSSQQGRETFGFVRSATAASIRPTTRLRRARTGPEATAVHRRTSTVTPARRRASHDGRANGRGTPFAEPGKPVRTLRKLGGSASLSILLLPAVSRRYLVRPLPDPGEGELPPSVGRHLAVVRARPGDRIVLFDGGGRQALATVLRAERHRVRV